MKRIFPTPYLLPTNALPTPYQTHLSLAPMERTTNEDVAALAGSREWEKSSQNVYEKMLISL